ncbi:MAG: non-homologous end-joining DNA ligase [Dermatophilaceae bacterium]|nr:non-homologous end-joining DNA ligase [Dermatophilaceae bacterium]MBP9917332.1 non-homologous end-joining DNA ligase [Dermatophilaceae bacterium]
MPSPKKVTVQAAGRRLAVSSLDKVMYPDTETTKGEVLHYYARIAPVLLPHLAQRPVTRIRFPHGVGELSFFEKNLPSGAPAWLPRVVVTHGDGASDGLTYPLVTGVDTLIYLANLNSLEFHIPQWQVDDSGQALPPDRIVIDLDPGPGTGLRECSRVALAVRERLEAIGLNPVPVTSGSKGMQVYAALPALPGSHSSDDLSAVAQQLAQELSSEMPDLVVWRMAKSARPGKVFIDWSQNNAAKTTISPYSMRGRDLPWAATPRSWQEIEQGARVDAGLTQATIEEVLDRVERHGDLAASLWG